MKRENDLYKALFDVECPDSTYHPENEGLIFAHATGCEVWDIDGKRYLDLCAGFGVHALGHNPDVFRNIWEQQLSDRPPVLHAMGDVYPSSDKVRLLTKLIEVMPAHLTKAGLALSGGQAVEFALKTAMLATKRSGVIAFREAYHGLDIGSLAVTFRADFRESFETWLPASVRFIDYDSDLETLTNQFGDALAALNASGCGLAAVIMEPIQGRAGVCDPGSHWRKSVARLAAASGALLILDEVFTGLGRSGRMTFADETSADLVCLGKPLGGGLPLSACVGTDAAMNAWPKNFGEAVHTGTFFGHPLACRLGVNFLSTLVEQDLCHRALRMGQNWRADLSKRFAAKGMHVQMRGQGLMVGIDYEKPLAGVKVAEHLRQQGVIALPSSPTGQVLSLTPPLTVTQDVLDEASEKILAASTDL